MKTINEQIMDKLIKHSAYLLRLVSKQSDDFIAALNKNNPKLAGFLIENLPDLNLSDTKASAIKWRKFEQGLKELRGSVIDNFAAEYDKESLKIIENEVKYMQALYKNTIGVKELAVAIPKLEAANLLNYGFIDGKTVGQYFGEIKYGDVDRIIQSVRTGLVEKKPAYKIVNDLIGSRDIEYIDGVTNLTRNNARSLVRTITQGIVNNSRSEFYRANDDIVKYERFTAVLDGRTTVECLSLDGEIYRLDQGPRPPLHRNCRSLRLGMVDNDLFGERSYITDTRTARERRIDWRADAKKKAGPEKWKSLSVKQRNGLIAKERTAWQDANIGRVPAKTTGAEWLKTQSAEFQNDYLGRKQAELFRSGELTLDKFVDTSGKKLSVNELYGMYAEEFKKAGIKP